MKLTTEKELFLYNKKEAFRVKQLFLTKKATFSQVADYLPFSIHINTRNTLRMTYSNRTLNEWSGGEGENIKKYGITYIRKISDPVVLEHMLSKVRLFEKINDPHSVCSAMQYVKLDGKMRFFYTNKLFLDNETYLNIGFRMDKFGRPGMLVDDILSEVIGEMNGIQKFQSLTKQEKLILIMLANGETNKQIADKLFISPHTVRTHRKNIKHKLEAKGIRDLIRFAQAFELM